MALGNSSKNGKVKESTAQDMMFADTYSAYDAHSSHDGHLEMPLEELEVTEEECPFALPLVPGGEDQSDYEPTAAVVVSDDDDIQVEHDPWKWTVMSFLEWLGGRMSAIPGHSGTETSGLERAIAYLQRLDSEISRAVRLDLDNKIAIKAVENARDEIQDGIKRLEERLDKVRENKYPRRKKKKKSEQENNAILKEAQKAAKFIVTVPIFESYIARTCINSMVSAGKDIEVTFNHMTSMYKLSSREQAAIMQLMSDMGYAMRWDRGLPREKVDTSSTDNYDLMANYPG